MTYFLQSAKLYFKSIIYVEYLLFFYFLESSYLENYIFYINLGMKLAYFEIDHSIDYEFSNYNDCVKDTFIDSNMKSRRCNTDQIAIECYI